MASMTLTASMKRTARRRQPRATALMALTLPCLNTALHSGPAKESMALIRAGRPRRRRAQVPNNCASQVSRVRGTILLSVGARSISRESSTAVRGNSRCPCVNCHIARRTSLHGLFNSVLRRAISRCRRGMTQHRTAQQPPKLATCMFG
eukprot:2186845-Alexandrium_andersonii.AAC.1